MALKLHKSGCYKVTIPLYLKSFYVATDIDQAESLTGDDYKNQQDESLAFVQEFETDPPLMVLIDKSPNSVAHECGHMAIIMCHMLGIDVTYNNQEPFCYILGYISEAVNDVIYRKDS